MRIITKLLLLHLLLVYVTTIFAQADSVNQRIILVGDAGELTGGKQPELELLKSLYNLDDARTSLIFLGDNIYPLGLPAKEAKNFEEKRIILQNQVDLVKGKSSRAFIIPGNHDWKQGKKDGWEQVKHEFSYIESLKEDNVRFVPEGGCPGPVEINLSDEIVLVVVDTQWWLHPYDKPGVSSDCDCKNTDEIVVSLKDIVYRNRNKLLLFSSHHPFRTYGKHGGYFTLKQHIFPLTEINPSLYLPLPIIGSIYPIARGVFGNIQDTKHPVYKRMIRSIDEVLSTHPYCIRTSGHEHNLQLIQDEGQDYIVSGGGSKSSTVRQGKKALFAAAEKGFAVMEILKSGRVWIKFFSTGNENTRLPLFAATLKSLEPFKEQQSAVAVTAQPDSVTIPGAAHFKSGAIRQFMLGKNYRKEWNENIRVAVFDIGKEQGGLKILQQGGGKQSKSLRLASANGSQYTLRSIRKFPANALPEEFRETFVKDLLVDGISASYPYSGLSIPPLAEVAGVPHANPKLVYVTDDARLGAFKNDFANTLCLLEEREPGGLDKTYSTPKVYERLADDNDNLVDQQAVLKARLLDMFVMDFDRHEDQWRWGSYEKEKEKFFYPIPRDRDQAFFTNSGLLPNMISRPWLIPQLQGFRARAKNINGFNLVARNFDRAFLSELTLDQWKETANALVGQLSDEAIEKAVRQQPPEIFKYSGDKIINTLKRRKNYLVEEAIKYYRFLAREVTVTGSDKKELFDVTRNDDGSVLVIVYKIDKKGDSYIKLFERKFIYSETKEIRLFGMGGADEFKVHGISGKTIKLRLIGGAGDDKFENAAQSAARKTIVYDLNGEKNELTGNLKKNLSSSPSVNTLDRLGYKYDILAPFISISYNQDDGIFLGASLKYTKHGFRKDPYQFVQQVAVNHALRTNSYNFGYKLEAVKAIGNVDVLFNGNIKAPNNTINFFKFGNESVYTKGKTDGIRYYRARFNLAEAALLFRVNPADKASLMAGPSFQYFHINREDNKGRLIAFPYLNGLDSNNVYKDKFYGGLQVSASVDNRDNKILPQRGINWQTTLKFNKGFGSYASNYSQINSDFSAFVSFNSPGRFVIATRIGGGINFGNYEFFQAQYLGGTENLRGFRKYRFAGDKMLYSNTEIRIKLTDLNTYLLPGPLGILAFYDVGRVWFTNEPSNKWHKGYGAGLWLAPLKRYVITASYTASNEGGLPLVTFGYQF